MGEQNWNKKQKKTTLVVTKMARPLHKRQRLAFQAVAYNARGDQEGSAVAHESNPKNEKQDESTPVTSIVLGRCIDIFSAKITGFCRLLYKEPIVYQLGHQRRIGNKRKNA